MLKGNKFAMLATEKEETPKDFTRRVRASQVRKKVINKPVRWKKISRECLEKVLRR